MGASSLYDREGPAPSGHSGTRDVETVDETALGPGAVIGGKYEILRVLGAGGMGTVLAARHIELGQTVAVKVMHADVAAESDSVKRFMREGRAAAHLRSDNAVRIHDVGRLASGLPFLVMEHLVGADLDHRRKLEVVEVVDYVIQAISAIAEAHDGGLVHRDIKPQNLFLAQLPDGTTRVKVLDFGLAKDLQAVSSGSAALTADHMILGSPHFMSPEQIRTPGQVDARADVWALGATMVQLLTGEPPYTAHNVHGLLARILADPTPKVRELRPDVPVALERIIERCMEKDRDRRYGSVIELATALQLALGFVPAGGASSRATRQSAPDLSAPAPPSLLASTRNSPLAAPLSAIPSTDREDENVTLYMAPRPVPTLPLGQTYEASRAPAAPAAPSAETATVLPVRATSAITALPRNVARPTPPRIARGWAIAAAAITIAALVVGGLALHARLRHPPAIPEGPPTIVAIPTAPPATLTIAAPSVAATEEPPLVATAPPPAPPTAIAATGGPKRPKTTPPPVATPPPTASAARDPYSWGK